MKNEKQNGCSKCGIWHLAIEGCSKHSTLSAGANEKGIVAMESSKTVGKETLSLSEREADMPSKNNPAPETIPPADIHGDAIDSYEDVKHMAQADIAAELPKPSKDTSGTGAQEDKSFIARGSEPIIPAETGKQQGERQHSSTSAKPAPETKSCNSSASRKSVAWVETSESPTDEEIGILFCKERNEIRKTHPQFSRMQMSQLTAIHLYRLAQEQHPCTLPLHDKFMREEIQKAQEQARAASKPDSPTDEFEDGLKTSIKTEEQMRDCLRFDSTDYLRHDASILAGKGWLKKYRELKSKIQEQYGGKEQKTISSNNEASKKHVSWQDEDELRKEGWIKDMDWGDIAPNYIRSNVIPQKVRDAITDALLDIRPNIIQLIVAEAGYKKR